jgi:hypothetical protein
MAFKDLWDLESAMKILEHPTIEANLWAEAVEWLLVNGPAEIRKVLLEASQLATKAQFPELQPSHFTADGQPIYDVAALARALRISEKEVQEGIARKGHKENLFGFPDKGSDTIH